MPNPQPAEDPQGALFPTHPHPPKHHRGPGRQRGPQRAKPVPKRVTRAEEKQRRLDNEAKCRTCGGTFPTVDDFYRHRQRGQCIPNQRTPTP